MEQEQSNKDNLIKLPTKSKDEKKYETKVQISLPAILESIKSIENKILQLTNAKEMLEATRDNLQVRLKATEIRDSKKKRKTVR